MRSPSRLIRNYSGLVTGQMASSALGFVFWTVAAREFHAAEVGKATATIGTFILAGSISVLGQGTMLVTELPLRDADRKRAMVRASLIACSSVGIVIGLLVFSVSGLMDAALRAAMHDAELVPFFVIGVASTAAAIAVDQAALVLHAARAQALRNIAAASLRYPVVFGLLWLGVRDAWVLVAAWVVPLAISVVVLYQRLDMPRGPRLEEDRFIWLVRRYWRDSIANQVLTIGLLIGPQLMPVLAALTLAPARNAEWSLAWQIATVSFMLPFLIVPALFAASAGGGEEAFLRNLRVSVPAAFGLAFGLIAGTWLIGGLFLQILGHRYAANSRILLDLLVLGGLWAVVRDHLIARARILRRLRRATVWIAVSGSVECLGAIIGGLNWGAEGLCVGWLSAQAVEMVFTAPTMWKLMRQVPWRASGADRGAAESKGHEVSR